LQDLRTFIEELKQGSDLVQVEEEVSTVFEAAALLKAFDGREAVYLSHVKGYGNPIVGGVCGTRQRLGLALGIQSIELHRRLRDAILNPIKPKVSSDGPILANRRNPNLNLIPALTHYEKDAGPYITSAAVYASVEGSIENVSVHRLQLIDERHLAIRIVPRHLYRLCQMAEEKGCRALDVSISVGLHPAVLLAASSPAPFGVSHFDVANRLLNGGLRLVKCPDVDAYAPSNAELVIEGRIVLDQRASEGPFVDITGTYDVQRQQPLVEVVGILHRDNYIYQALLPAGSEHRLLMGLPQEMRVWEYVQSVLPTVRGVNMTLGGCGWLHCVVSVDKFRDGDPKNVLMAVFAANPSIKHAVVVDSDIDIYDPEQVEWAIATRLRGDRGLIVIPGVRVSSLDPASDQELELGCKVGVDATRPLQKPREKFERAKIPISPRVEEIIRRLKLRKENA
jgi:UbiD family decarboxylase